MKRFLVLVAFCLVFAVSGVAQVAQPAGPDAPATKEDVEAYLQAIHYHELMANTLDAMTKPMHEMIHQEFLKDKDKLPPDFEDRMTRETDNMLKNMPFDEMVQAMVPAYEKHLTKGDLQAMTAFYESPAGQKLLKEMPAIMSEAMQDVIPIMSRYMDTVKAHLQDEIQQALKQQPSAPPSGTPPATSN
jgi:uncharacterized protein